MKRFQWLTRLLRPSSPHQPKKARTGAERARAYRQRRRQKAKAASSPNHESPSSESLIPEDFSSEDSAFAEPPLTPPPTVTVLDVARDGDAPSRGNAKATPSVSYASCRNRGRVMASNIITQTSGSLVTPTRTDVATLMDTALAPFNLRDRWSEAIEAARKATPFVAVDDDDELVALGDNVDWPSSRARAVEIQQKLPPLTEITAACKAVDKTLRVKPVPEEYQILASKMLDVLGIRGGDDTDAYTEALAWTWRMSGPAAAGIANTACRNGFQFRHWPRPSSASWRIAIPGNTSAEQNGRRSPISSIDAKIIGTISPVCWPSLRCSAGPRNGLARSSKLSISMRRMGRGEDRGAHARGRNASLKCVSPARSHTNRVPTPWRSLSGCHGIQHPGSGKKPACRVR
jgi:hypothetical protein